MRMNRLFAILGFATTIARTSEGQAPYRQVLGTVRDSASGRAPTRTWVCAFVDSGSIRPVPRCGGVDSLGEYRIDSVGPGPRLLAVHCATVHGPMSLQLAFDHIVLGDTNLRRDWTVHATGCDSRRVRRVTGTFRGHYTPGFEASTFVPCPSDEWFLPSDSLGAEPFLHRAWVTWPPGAARGPQWRDAPRDSFGNPHYYVQWRGTVVGPGSYGHMGASPFEFRVDSVLTVQPTRRGDCR
jgi:hypothetical protein